MHKWVFAAVVAVMLGLAPLAVQADEVDMARITCKEFLNDKEGMPAMIMWIDGYMSAKSNNTMMTDAWIEKLGVHLGTYCAKNPGNTIMQAMEAVPQ